MELFRTQWTHLLQLLVVANFLETEELMTAIGVKIAELVVGKSSSELKSLFQGNADTRGKSSPIDDKLI